MATRGSASVQPKADQPRVSTDTLKRAEASPSLQYREKKKKSLDRASKQRNYGRAVRG